MWQKMRDLRLLLVDDDPNMYPLLREYLYLEFGKRCQLDWSKSYQQALDTLLRSSYDVVIVDYLLDEKHTGAELIQELRRQGKNIPAIVLTVKQDQEVVVQVLHAGAFDYLCKEELTPSLLARSVQYAWQRAWWERQNYMQDKLASLGRMASGIAHDFNNILQSILGYAQLLQLDPRLPEELRRDVRAIQKQVLRASTMITQILDFARCDRHSCEPVSLRAVVRETVQFLQKTFPDDIVLKTSFRVERDYVLGSFGKLQQILMNLLLNARDSMPQGGEIQIVVRLGELIQPPQVAESTPQEWVVLEVIDTGIGIPSDILPHIFDPFFTTKGQKQGTGLGLAQVYGLVKQHDGFIDVESIEGKGTTFSVYFPRHTLPEELQDQQGVSSTNYSRIPRGKGESIVLVEDDDELRETLERMLKALGYSLTSYANGQEAKSHLESTPADLLITDVSMPKMGGLELVRSLTTDGRKLKVILLTGYPLPRDAMDHLEKCTWKLLTKPIKLSRLADLVRDMLTQP